jgi:hypothetical protein
MQSPNDVHIFAAPPSLSSFYHSLPGFVSQFRARGDRMVIPASSQGKGLNDIRWDVAFNCPFAVRRSLNSAANPQSGGLRCSGTLNVGVFSCYNTLMHRVGR